METLNYRERSRPADVVALPSSPLLIDLDDARPLAQAIVDTIRDPLLVLDQDLRVVTANRAFCQAFQDESSGYSWPPGLRAGRWPVGYSRASVAAGRRGTPARRDGGLRSRARLSHYRATLDAPERARAIFSEKLPQAHSSGDRRRHRPSRRRTGDNQSAATEGNAAAGDTASRRQQPANHRQHPFAQSADGEVRGNAAAS